MSDDQNAATVMEEIQKMRKEMIDLKTQVKTAEDRAEKAEEAARNAEAGRARCRDSPHPHQPPSQDPDSKVHQGDDFGKVSVPCLGLAENEGRC